MDASLAAMRLPELPDFRALTGLSSAEAAERLSREGPNEIPSARRRNILRLAGEVLREPMILLLVACSAIYLALGDLREAVILSASVFVVIGITLYQNRRTERALEALRDLSSPRALVIRDGEAKRIAGREVVRGDLILVSEGDRVPADGEVLVAVPCVRGRVAFDGRVRAGEQAPASRRRSRARRARIASSFRGRSSSRGRLWRA